MSSIRSSDTRPEMFVRRLVFAQGYRYRLHNRTLPGTPDLVFPGRKKKYSCTAAFGMPTLPARPPECPNRMLSSGAQN